MVHAGRDTLVQADRPAEASGLSVRDFAAEYDLNPATFAWWRSRLWSRAARVRHL
ncbi:MAG: hypothetical protein ABMB14_36165 [Myxococcota bacterium]